MTPNDGVTVAATSGGSDCPGVPAWVAGDAYSVSELVTYVCQAGDDNPNPGVVGKTYEYRCAIANSNPSWTPGAPVDERSATDRAPIVVVDSAATIAAVVFDAGPAARDSERASRWTQRGDRPSGEIYISVQ